MLSALFPEIDWPRVQTIGFDMDGTLYDEFEFISQAYGRISDALAEHWGPGKGQALAYMKRRWLEKGSSYNRIFEETYEKFVEGGLSKQRFIGKALDLFRTTRPVLTLPQRNRQILEFCQERYRLFLVTDGNQDLQKRKFTALGLNAFFSAEETVFTDALGTEYCKPSIRALDLLPAHFTKETAVYIGDRHVDKEFAKAAGVSFLPVYNMIPSR